MFCGSIRADLVVAHPGGTAPSVEISSIVVSSAPLDRAELDPGITCKVDRLGGAPHGIPERGVYFVTLNDRNVSTSYKDTGGVTREMDPGNVLRLKSGGSDTVPLPRGDTRRDIRDFRITTKAEQPQQLTFRISYDQDGEKKVETRRVVIWK